MKIAIMQPYLFPYIGYFQLIKAVDNFVFFDDVNYINKGWINRNRILNEQIFTLPLVKASQNRLIKDIEIFDSVNSKNKLLKNIFHAYKKAPYFAESYKILEEIILNPSTNLSDFVANSLIKISHYLEIKTHFLFSSQMNYDRSLDGQGKIISILKNFNNDSLEYINASGGTALYDKNLFLENSMKLRFIKNKKIIYKQFSDDFIDNLSIIDVMMFCDKSSIIEACKT